MNWLQENQEQSKPNTLLGTNSPWPGPKQRFFRKLLVIWVVIIGDYATLLLVINLVGILICRLRSSFLPGFLPPKMHCFWISHAESISIERPPFSRVNQWWSTTLGWQTGVHLPAPSVSRLGLQVKVNHKIREDPKSTNHPKKKNSYLYIQKCIYIYVYRNIYRHIYICINVNTV